MSKFLKDFKEFAMRGNVLDMAVGVIIGGAFGKIVTSLVNDLIMPIIGKITGGINFTHLSYELSPAVLDETGTEVTPAVLLNYGAFIQNVIDFLIIAFCIFLVIKAMMKFQHKKEEEPELPAIPEPTAEEKLLTEIRDLLKDKK
jgi:large conductance mechanosensitive channel